MPFEKPELCLGDQAVEPLGIWVDFTMKPGPRLLRPSSSLRALPFAEAPPLNRLEICVISETTEAFDAPCRRPNSRSKSIRSDMTALEMPTAAPAAVSRALRDATKRCSNASLKDVV